LSVAPVRESGLGAVVARTTHTGVALAGIGAGVVIALAVIGPWGAIAVGGAALSAVVVGRLSVSKIGGIVGDALGAAEQVTECIVLVVAVAVVHGGHHLPWWS
jgi:adenosylcobinamide-GDP ribazoletransferase